MGQWRSKRIKSRRKRLFEFTLTVTIIALLCGIAVPFVAKSLAEAHSVTAKHNLATAEQAIDIALIDDSSVDVASLQKSFSGIQWLDYNGQDLKDCKRFKEKQRSSVYFTRLPSGAICIFAIPTDGSLIYSIYSDGTWHEGEKTKNGTNLQAVILSLR